MKNIGEILQKRREELGYTLRNMSEKTKVPIAKLSALEEGDLKYFADDMSYVKFYVRYYCNALLIDFELYKDELDHSIEAFYNTTKLIKIKENQQIQERVQERTQGLLKKRKSRYDFSFISFIASMVLLTVSLSVVFILFILPNLSFNQPLVIDETPIPRPPEVIDEVVEEPVVEPLVLSLSQVGPVEYVISGFQEAQELTLVVNFKSNAYVRIKIDGESAINIPSKLYNVGSTLDFKFKAYDQAVLEIYIGWMNGNTMLLDDIDVPVNTEFATRSGSVTFSFKMIGANEE
jgi:transcriptional regulator with XRE-family HTH domain